MSDKITYILEVLDKFSTNTKKFKFELISIKRVASDLNSVLTKTNTNFAWWDMIQAISSNLNNYFCMSYGKNPF